MRAALLTVRWFDWPHGPAVPLAIALSAAASARRSTFVSNHLLPSIVAVPIRSRAHSGYGTIPAAMGQFLPFAAQQRGNAVYSIGRSGANGTLEKKGPPGLGGPPSLAPQQDLSLRRVTSRAAAERAGAVNLAEFAARRRVPQALVVETALGSYLFFRRIAQKRLEAALRAPS